MNKRSGGIEQGEILWRYFNLIHFAWAFTETGKLKQGGLRADFEV
jgi:hypothetical protein